VAPAPVRFTNLGAQRSFRFQSPAPGHAQVERPPRSFCVGDAAPPDVLRATLVSVHPLLLPDQSLAAHAGRVILWHRRALVHVVDARPRCPVLARTPVPCALPLQLLPISLLRPQNSHAPMAQKFQAVLR